MRAGSSFRVVLYGERRPVLQTDAFNGFIVEVDVCDLDIGSFPHCSRVYAKTMVLGGDLASAGDEVLHRMIQPSVSMVHLERRDIVGESQQLVSQANTEQGFLFRQDL